MTSATKMKKSTTTRQQTVCPIFGHLTELNERVLPTEGDIMKFYLFLRNEKLKESERDPRVSELSDLIAVHLENLWLKASIPFLSRQQIVAKIEQVHDKYRNILKPFKSRQNEEKYKQKLQEYCKAACNRLLDISACKCLNFLKCSCPKEKKVPIEEREFLCDQRTVRRMAIGDLDKQKTKELQKRQVRNEKEELRLEKHLKNSSFTCKIDYDSYQEEEFGISDTDSNDFDPDVPSSSKNVNRPKQMRIPLQNFARECDRHGVSDRSAAKLASAVLQDLGVINEEDKSKVIDRNKVRRERVKSRRSANDSKIRELTGLYFDGRKDMTRKQEKKGHKFHSSIVKQEHITLVQEPDSKYIGHFPVENGTALALKNGIVGFCEEKDISLENLLVVGCDGTNVNTGVSSGAIRLLEIELKRPLQWFICMLHINELPLRHILLKLDGVTTGPRAFSGRIGKAIQDCQKLPILTFAAIDGPDLPALSKDIDLSTDQRYLYDMCCSIKTGKCDDDLANKKPGPVNHSRWLTTASRILRLYVATEKPSKKLMTLSSYVVKVYVPVWFSIKTKWSCIHGARHLWTLIQYSRYLDPEVLSIVNSVIQRNAFYAHPENLLLAMLTDEREHVQKLAHRRIRAAKNTESSEVTVRVFSVPQVNFAAGDYIDLIDWQKVPITVPPVLRNIPSQDIVNIANIMGEVETTNSTIDIPNFPCHTQATERCVKLVTEAAESVCGQDQRDGFIKTTIKSRNLMKTFNTKKEFNVTH